MVSTMPDSTAAAAGEAAPVEVGASSDIFALSKLALQDAAFEFEAVVRKTRMLSSAAVQQLFLSAEQQLGLEVEIEDPALQGLFGLHVLAVEELCHRVRAQADVLLAATEAWSKPEPARTTELFTAASSSSSAIESLGEDLADAAKMEVRTRMRLQSRIESEVLTHIDIRLQEHEELRAHVRERQRWQTFAAAARDDVAWARKVRKGRPGSGLQALDLLSEMDPLQQAEARLHEAGSRVAALDSLVLARLTELKAWSVDAVRRPWAALIQIQAEYFTAQQVMWLPLVDSFSDAAEQEVNAR